MALQIAYTPGFSDIADSLLDAGAVVNGQMLTALKHNAAFGSVAWEVFYGQYQDGDTVPQPTSPVDGYTYQRSELMYYWEDFSTSPSNVIPSAQGGLLWQRIRVDQSTGDVRITRAYYVDGGAETDTTDGVLAVWAIGIRGRGLRTMAAQPGFTDLPASDFADDNALSTSTLKYLSHNAKLGTVRSEAFLMNPSTAAAWQSGTSYAVGDFVQPTTANANGAWFRCALAGTSGSTEPTWPSDPASPTPIIDGSVIWNIAGFGFRNGQQIPLPVSPVDGYAYSAGECVAILPFWYDTTAIPYPSEGGWNVGYRSGTGNIERLLKSITGTQGNAPSGTQPPAAPTLTLVSGGSLGARTEYYQITYTNAQGESSASTEVSIAAGAGQLVKVTSPAQSQGANGYRVYAATTSGAEAQQTATAVAIGTDWTEATGGLTTGTVAPPGVSVPSVGAVPRQQADIHGIAAWAATTAYAVGDLVVDSNFRVQRCITAGTSGATAPTWPSTMGTTTADGTVTWQLDLSAGGYMQVVPTNIQDQSTSPPAPGTSTTGCGIVSLGVQYENGTFPDGTVGVLVITQRAIASMAAPGGNTFTDFDDADLMSGQPLEGQWMRDINTNAKFSILRPEVFTATYKGGQTVALPTSPIDGYIYSRGELTYQWYIQDTGQPAGVFRDFLASVDPQTGLVSTRTDYFVNSGDYKNIGTVIRGTATIDSGGPVANDGLPVLLVVMIAQRLHESELLSTLQLGTGQSSAPAPPSTNNLIPNGDFALWTSPNTTAVSIVEVPDDWGLELEIGDASPKQAAGLNGATFAMGLYAHAATQYQTSRAATFGSAGQVGVGSMLVPIAPGGVYGLSFLAQADNSIAGGFFCRVYLFDSTQSQEQYFELLGDMTPNELSTNLGASLTGNKTTNFSFSFTMPQNGDTGVVTSAGSASLSGGTLGFQPAYAQVVFYNIAPVRGGSAGEVIVSVGAVRMAYLQQAAQGVSNPIGEWNSQTTFTAGQAVSYSGAYYRSLTTNTNSTPSPSNTDWQAITPGTVDVHVDGQQFKRVAAVNSSNQATTGSIESGATSAVATATTSDSGTISAGTPTQVASITITPNGGYVSIDFRAPAAYSGTGSFTLKVYRGDNTGTQLGPTLTFTPGSSLSGLVFALSALGVDASPPSTSQQYTVYAETSGSLTLEVFPGVVTAINGKV